MSKKEIGVWYKEKDFQYSMIDPDTGGTWIVTAVKEESEQSLDSLVNFHLANSEAVERPPKGTVSILQKFQ